LEGNLIIGANNRSAVGTLVERTTHLVILAKVDGTTATAAAVGFIDKLNEVPRSLRLSLTYDQDKEMVKHAEITQKTGTAIYSPRIAHGRGVPSGWPCLNTNGLLRQYLPKGTDLSAYSQEELDEITDSLNTRPRKTLDWRTPLEVYAEMLKKSVIGPSPPSIVLHLELEAAISAPAVSREAFRYVPERNEYRVPARERLIWRFKNVNKGQILLCYWRATDLTQRH